MMVPYHFIDLLYTDNHPICASWNKKRVSPCSCEVVDVPLIPGWLKHGVWNSVACLFSLWGGR